MESTQQIEFGGKMIYATVTASGSTVSTWIRKTTSGFQSLQTVVVALDVNWKSNKKSNKKKNSSAAATLQLCIHNKCLIVQLLHIDIIPRSLEKLLFNKRYVFVGVDVELKAEKLEEDYGLVCRRRSDLRSVAVEKWRPGLKELAEEVAGLRLDKPKRVTMSNWESKLLSQQHIQCACVDAYASFTIGMKLRKELGVAGIIF